MSALATLLIWLVLGTASAQDPRGRMADPRPDSLEGLVRDLAGSDRSRRTFAIRELNRIARISRKHEFGPLTSEATIDALQNLEFLDQHAANVCIQHLRLDVEVRGCARLLGYLETAAGKTALQAARTRTDRKATIRRIDRTLAILAAENEESTP